MTPRKPARLNLPEALNGPFSGAVIGTYGVDIDFLEAHLLRRMPRHLSSRVVLADAMQLHTTLTSGIKPRKANRSYVLAPVTTPHAFHPKFILLTGATHGRLLVGSGNATVGGYIGPGEAFTTYDYTPEESGHIREFAAVKDFLNIIREENGLDAMAWRIIEDQLEQAAWIQGDPEAPTVIHNRKESHLNQLQARLGSEKVLEVIAYAPFHDRKAQAIRDILKSLQPERLTLLAQQHQTTLDIKATTKAVASLGDKFRAFSIKAPAPYEQTYLHAKLVLVRTAQADHLLQGSANLSSVALSRFGVEANVEMGNLLTGKPGEFDPFINAIEWTPIPADLSNLDTAAWSDPTPKPSTLGLIRNACWLPPHLTGTCSQSITATDIRVIAADKAVNPSNTELEHTREATDFTLTFETRDVEAINSARHLTIAITGHEPIDIYPYWVNDLLRMSSTGNRIDLLRDIGADNLNDKEIIDLLEVLDHVLIVDMTSAWKLAHPQQPAETQDEKDHSRLSYEDIDWELVRQHSAYKAFTGHRPRHDTSPTELAILLDSLAERFRQDATGQRAPTGGLDDLDHEQESEDADQVDEDSSDEEEADSTRRLPPSARVKRMWRSFIKRFETSLNNSDFINAMGPGVLIPSYIAFNHLMRLLRSRDLIDPDYVTQAQIRLWNFFYGDQHAPGYLDGLSQQDQDIAQELITHYDDIPLTLAALDDAYQHAYNTVDHLYELRDTARTVIANTLMQPTPQHLTQAAQATMTDTCQTAQQLADDLYSLVLTVDDTEFEKALAITVDLPYTSLRWAKATIRRGGADQQIQEIQLPDEYNLTPQRATALLAEWSRLDPERPYLRVSAGTQVAYYDTGNDEAVQFDRKIGTEAALNLEDLPQPLWLRRVTEWSETAAA